jgi:Xaa-Pro aminopeptidase
LKDYGLKDFGLKDFSMKDYGMIEPHITGDPREATGPAFSRQLQHRAQTRAWETLAFAAAKIEPGMDDVDGKAIVDQAIMDSGAQRLWHASQVRFGPNTMLPFGVIPEKPHVLEANDVFFLDIGPYYEGHEGDVGRGFTLGRAPQFEALIGDSKTLFEAVKNHWRESGCNGQELYDFARETAATLGRTMALEGASGHRIGDFPTAFTTAENSKTSAKPPPLTYGF